MRLAMWPLRRKKRSNMVLSVTYGNSSHQPAPKSSIFELPLRLAGRRARGSSYVRLCCSDLLQLPFKPLLVLIAFERASGFDKALMLLDRRRRFLRLRFARIAFTQSALPPSQYQTPRIPIACKALIWYGRGRGVEPPLPR